jgi:hypothetical protein
MYTLQLDAATWADYIVSTVREESEILVTVELADRIAHGAASRTWRALRSVRYDARDDVLVLAVGGENPERPALRYYVTGPRQVTVSHEDGATTVLVVDTSEVRTLIRLQDPLKLIFAPWQSDSLAWRSQEASARAIEDGSARGAGEAGRSTP